MSSLAGVKADLAGGEQAGSVPFPTSATGGSFVVMVKSKPLVLRAGPYILRKTGQWDGIIIRLICNQLGTCSTTCICNEQS